MIIREKEFNATTGEETITEREETTAEKKAREKAEADNLTLAAELKAKEAQRKAILDRLGISAEELKTILG
jgi:hypothetical protein